VGKYIKTIGKKGQGPGEFNMPFEIAVSNNQLIVWDIRNRRLCALTLDGEHIKSVSISLSEGHPNKIRALPSGDIVIGLEKSYRKEEDKPQDYLIAIYSPDLKRKKTIYTQQVWRNRYKIIGGMLRNIIQPFSSLVYWDIAPMGKIVIGYSEKYDIEIYDSIKGKIATFSHRYDPVKVMDKDKKIFFAGGTILGGGGVMKKTTQDDMAKYRQWPKFKPAFKQIRVDSEGNILVWPYREKREEEWRFFHVFNPEGDFVGNVQVTGEIVILNTEILSDGSFWKKRSDKEGFVRIVKYRISDQGEI